MTSDYDRAELREIAETIRDCREDNDMTQEEFSETVGATRETISRWENAAQCPSLFYASKLLEMGWRPPKFVV